MSKKIWRLLPLLAWWLVSPLTAQPQLGNLEFEEMPSEGIIVDNPEVAVLVVETTVMPLSFRSGAGIRSVSEPEAGIYWVFVEPGVHAMEIRAEGHLVLRLPLWNFPQKTGRRIRVKPEVLAAPDPGQGTLIIESTPRGAVITLNGIQITQRTPVTLPDQKSGEYRIGLLGMDGYEELDTTAVVRADDTTRVVVALAPQVGHLLVESVPSGASVLLGKERRFVGETPVHITDLPPGWHIVRLEKNNYDAYETEVQVRRKVTGDLTVTLHNVGTRAWEDRRKWARRLAIFPGFGLGQFISPGQSWRGLLYLAGFGAAGYLAYDGHTSYDRAERKYQAALQTYRGVVPQTGLDQQHRSADQFVTEMDDNRRQVTAMLVAAGGLYVGQLVDAWVTGGGKKEWWERKAAAESGMAVFPRLDRELAGFGVSWQF